MGNKQNGKHEVITNVDGADGVDGEYEPFSDAVVAAMKEYLRQAILAKIMEEREEEEEEEE